MKMHKSVKEREGEKGLREVQRVSRIPHKQTQHKLGRTERRSHFLLTCKRDWCGCLYQWVCMSCLTLFTDVLTPLSWNSRESFNLLSCSITRAWAEVRNPEPRRQPGIFRETSHCQRPADTYTPIYLQLTGRTTLRASDTLPSLLPTFALYGAGVLRTTIFRLSRPSSKDFCSTIVAFTDVLSSSLFNATSTSTRDMELSPGGGKINFISNMLQIFHCGSNADCDIRVGID